MEKNFNVSFRPKEYNADESMGKILLRSKFYEAWYLVEEFKENCDMQHEMMMERKSDFIAMNTQREN